MNGSDLRRRLRLASSVLAATALLLGVQAAAASPSPPPISYGGLQNALNRLNDRARAYGLANHAPPSAPTGASATNFDILGHNDLGNRDTDGDVWVHGNFAYVGTWEIPCTGRGVKIVDVSDLTAPKMIGALAARPGTSAEDMVVRHVSTPSFTGDLLAVGLQRCGDQAALDRAKFGPDFCDVTDPRNPVQVGQWGAGAHGLSPGPFYGLGSFGASFDHSVRASADGTKAYVSYWDLGVLTLDISDVTNPTLVGQTHYPLGADGDGHSVSFYQGTSRSFLLQNDEDFDPRSPAFILYGAGSSGIASESPGGSALWLQPGHSLTAPVVVAANQGCAAADYPANTAGKIAIARTPFPFFDPVPGESPLCLQGDQDAAAAAAGAIAVVHDFTSTATSPQFFDFQPVNVPVLFTDDATAQGMAAAGSATLQAQQPSWGFLRVFDASSGNQVAKFDALPNVHALPAPNGFWAIHNNEVVGNRSYASWYSNGVVALDLSPLNQATPADPVEVGQFLPAGGTSKVPGFIPTGVPVVWGVAIRPSDKAIFVSDVSSGLWIVRATGPAAP